MRTVFVLLSLAAMVAAGCGGGSQPIITQDQEKENALAQVGEMVRFYQVSKNKPPTRFADLGPVRAVAGNGYDAVKSGDVILLYGASLSDTSEEPGQSTSDEVLAYQKQVPEAGGKVIMLDRSIKTMTAEEFKSAKKAGKS